MKLRVYSQSWASGDIYDIEDTDSKYIEISIREFNRRIKTIPNQYHAIMMVLDEHEAKI
jgi:hypothetical protein